MYFFIWASLCLSSKECACNTGDAGSVPGSGSSPGEGNGNPLQYSRLENPMDRAGGLQSTGSRVGYAATETTAFLYLMH